MFCARSLGCRGDTWYFEERRKMIKKVDHIAIAVNDLNKAIELYDKLFGFKPARIETIPDQAVKVALIPIGEEGEIGLFQPTDAHSRVAKFLERRGEGVHHIAFEVDDVNQELKSLAAKGVELIDKEGRKGMTGKIAFLHPKSTGGLLIELIQKI